jgi:glucokinase
VEVTALAGVGAGSPGQVDGEAGTVANAGNLPGWEGGVFPLASELERHLGIPARIGNDVQVAVDGEAALGAGRPHRSMLGVFWGTGVGGGLILDGRPWIGRHAAGEIGHMVVKVGGARCGCGRRGCMEAYAGRGAMEDRARSMAQAGQATRLFDIQAERGKERLTSGVWKQALQEGDRVAERVMDRAVAALGVAIASAQNLLDVEAIVLGGGMGTRFGPPMADRIAAAMLPHLFAGEDPPPVLAAGLGDLGGAIGASLLVADLA